MATSSVLNVVITGASRGIGLATAEAFAGEGCRLLLSARQPAALEEAARGLQQRYPGSQVMTRAADLSDPNEAKALGDWVLTTAGTADILVNNAGLFYPGSVCSEPEGSLESQLAVNLYSAYHLTRRLLPAMMAAGRGHIFNLCSIASLNAYPNGGAYSISKFALYGFSKNLREEMKPHGIKVTHVLPGAAYTDSWRGSGVDPNRLMEAADIARMILAASRLSPQACVEEIVLRPLLGDL